jgi:hypothetical protein
MLHPNPGVLFEIVAAFVILVILYVFDFGGYRNYPGLFRQFYKNESSTVIETP